VGVTVKSRVLVSKVMKAASREPVDLSTRTTVEVLTQAEAPVHDLIAGEACSEAALTVAFVSVFVSTGDFISFVLTVTIVGWSQVIRLQLQVAYAMTSWKVTARVGYSVRPRDTTSLI
jgi:hypothetical protein